MPYLGPFPHGVSWSDVPTSILAPRRADVGLNVVFGAAPLHLRKNGRDFVNKARLYNNYPEAVRELGYSDDWEKYTICEHMDSLFVQFAMFPVVYIPVWDPQENSTVMPATEFTLVDGEVDTQKELLAWTVQVRAMESAPQALEEGVDYTLSLSKAGTWVITRLSTGLIPSDTSSIWVSGREPHAELMTSADVIGGIDINTGERTGLEVIEEVFPIHRKVPGIIVIPKFDKDPIVASVANAKSENINGCFACTCLVSIDTDVAKVAQDAPLFKNRNNMVFPRQTCLFGKPALLGQTQRKVYNFCSQQGPLMQHTDVWRGRSIPYFSPSNKNLRMNALLREDGEEINLNLFDANYLNSHGIVTAINWIGGWKSWGNRTACFPDVTDVKDMFIPVRRTFDFVGNTIVLTIWQKVDDPGNRRLIDSIVTSIQLWLDGIQNEGALLGARIEFLHSENPATELLNGHYVFHVFIAVPTPAEWLEFRIEYWIPYLNALFEEPVEEAIAA
jgi:phage tail sheath protein FI